MSKILATGFAGLELKNPIIVASSGLTNTAEKNRNLEKAGAGAVILPSLFEEQIEIQSGTDTLKDCPEANDYVLNSIRSAKICDYLNLIRESKKLCHIPVIASINCFREGDWIDFVSQIEMAGADAIELNIFALDTEKDNDSLENIYLQITQKVKEKVTIPLIVKMSKYFSNIVSVVEDLQSVGSDGVVLFNRFYQPDIDINQLTINSGHVFSSPTDIGDTLRWTAIVNGKHPDISLASCTGIHEWEDAIKCILCGASAIELCSAIYQHGNETIKALKQGMEEWMVNADFKSVADFRGKLNYSRIQDPSLYERIQFLKYFSNRD
jgi:dihydroorotate dehydrogenase (fumarate)